MKKLWIPIHVLLIGIMVSPLYLSWLFPALALADLLILAVWRLNSGTECMKYYQKGFFSIMYHDRIQYRRLVRKKLKKQDDFPTCLQELSASSTCIIIYFVTAILFIILRFLLKLW